MYKKILRYLHSLLFFRKLTVLKLSSLHDPRSWSEAADIVKKGGVIGVDNRHVFAIWGDGENPDITRIFQKIKGENRGNAPLALSLPAAFFVKLIDSTKIPQNLHYIFLDAEKYAERLGSLCFVRVPLKKDFLGKIPKAAVSWSDGVPYIQNWDPSGHDATFNLVQGMIRHEINYPVVTSMNLNGQPEIIDKDSAEIFCKEHGIQLLLIDTSISTKRAPGSYTIIELSKESIKVMRDGNIPHYLIAHVLETKLDVTSAKSNKFSRPDFPSDILKLNPSDARIAIINFISTSNKVS